MGGRRIGGELHPVPALNAQDVAAGNATLNGPWTSLERWDAATAIVLATGGGTAGQDPEFSLQQATDSAGTGARALTAAHWYRAEASTAATLTDELADIGEGTAEIEGEDFAMLRGEISAEDLDDGHTHIRLRAARGGQGGTKIVSAILLLSRPRYPDRIDDGKTAL